MLIQSLVQWRGQHLRVCEFSDILCVCIFEQRYLNWSKERWSHQISKPHNVHEWCEKLSGDCSKFIPSFSNISQPLWDLTMKDTWTKQVFQQATNQSWPTFIQARLQNIDSDALPWELSAILVQKSLGQDDRKLVAYISRALTDVEKCFLQTEREALAIADFLSHHSSKMC